MQKKDTNKVDTMKYMIYVKNEANFYLIFISLVKFYFA